jgi:hypothetical protein
MHNLPSSSDKFVPLRRFAASGLFNSRYLSQLVQRGRLKAKKIGRNYCCTRADFEAYLELHALDDTRIAYQKLFEEVDRQAIIKEQVLNAPVELAIPSKKHIKIPKKAVVIATVLLILALAAMLVVPRLYDQAGRVAGEEEAATNVVPLYEKN